MSNIHVKGDRDGLVIVLPPEGESTEMLEQLQLYLAQSGSFFKGAQVTLEVGARELDEEALQRLRALLAQWEMTLQALRSEAEQSRAAALASDLEVPFVVPLEVAVAGSRQSFEVPEESVEALLVRRTLRSGQVVRHPGAIVVLGDVNPGAEILAGGDVLIWGTLRGLVHAGAMGDEQAIVCALRLAPMQLRIGDKIAAAPEKGPGHKRPWQRTQPGPELARVHEGSIVIEPWPGQKKG